MLTFWLNSGPKASAKPPPIPKERTAVGVAGAPGRMNSYDLSTMLELLVKQGGSDLHLSVGSPPRVRVDGVLEPIEGPELTPEDTALLAKSALSGEQWETLERDLELDLSFAQEGCGRFRANVFRQQGAVGDPGPDPLLR